MLIIDTSTEQLKVLLKTKNTIIENEETSTKHLKTLLPQIDIALQKASLKLSDIKTYCVVLGPGSFTGVRIGVSTIKAFLCANKNVKVVGINLLELLAFAIVKSIKQKNNFAIIIKSTTTKYYFGVSNKEGKLQTQKMLTTAELDEFFKSNKMDLYSFNTEYKSDFIISAKISLLTQNYIDFCEEKIAKKQFEKEIKPIYLALSQAEEELLKKQQSK